MTTYEPGTEIAGYRIESLIGRGGMAVVYRAEDMRLGRKVALKLLTPQLADNEQFRQRFIRESRLAASLDHPNIVPIYEAGEADGQLFIAMRYVIGPDLKGLLADAGRPAARWTGRCRLFRQIGDALDSAHRAGLVHRDVKPGNILVAAAGSTRGHASRRPRLPHGLRAHQAHVRAVGRADRHRALPRHRRLRLARADPGQAGRAGHGHLRAGLRALRVPDRAAALPPGRRRRAAVGAPGRDASPGHGDPSRGPRGGRRRGGAGHGEGPGGPVRVVRGARCTTSSRPSACRRAEPRSRRSGRLPTTSPTEQGTRPCRSPPRPMPCTRPPRRRTTNSTPRSTPSPNRSTTPAPSRTSASL